jgi:hypothetical protein
LVAEHEQADANTPMTGPVETLDLFLTREAAEAELREILLDEPDWREVLRVVPIEPRRARLVTQLAEA